MSYLSLKDISFSYGKQRILNGLSLDIELDQIVALVGPSGCGKSTLLRLILGLERPEKGTISLNSKCIASTTLNTPINKRNIGIVFQKPSLFPHLTVQKNITFGLKSNKITYDNQLIDHHLALIELENHKEKFPHELSGGEQQRIALIRSLILNPDIMLLDEPFANLDSVTRRKLRSEVVNILKTTHTTSIFVTHDPLEAMEIADKIVVMNEGNIVQQDTAQNIYQHPKSLFCASFFGYLNTFNAKKEDEHLTVNNCSFSINDLPPQIQDALRHKKNKKFLVYIRPENINLSTQQSPDTIEGKVQFISFSGHYCTIFVKIAGLSDLIRVNVNPQYNIRMGDTIFLKIDAHSMLIFNHR